MPPAYPNINAHQTRVDGVVRLTGPLRDPRHPAPDLVRTLVVATVVQQPGEERATKAPARGQEDLVGPDGVM
ncbi:hypothetical protein ACQ7B2_13110, partial [Escherichia coli]